jgi:predicted enzyme related to lactoylglutathione lyase
MSELTGSNAWPGGIGAITLFVEDLKTAKGFYQQVFGLPAVYEDENSAVFKFGEPCRARDSCTSGGWCSSPVHARCRGCGSGV